jgi:hypothetical protein
MLAICHHFCVSYAVNVAKDRGLIPKNTIFKEYMVLGDDIIIWNKAVATCYYEFMVSDLGVEINLNKSLISTFGVFEFAKRLIHPESGLISAVPLKEFSLASDNISVLAELFRKFRFTVKISNIFRIFGFGYKVLGKLNALNFKTRAGLLMDWATMPGLSSNSSPNWAE